MIPLLSSFLFLISCYILLSYLSELSFKKATIKITAFILPLIWEHILSLPLFISKKFTSTELSKMMTDYESSLMVILKTSFDMLSEILLLLLLLSYLFINDLLVSEIYIIAYLILLSIRIFVQPTLKKLSENRFLAQSKSDTYLYETIAQIHKIKTANAEKLTQKNGLQLLLESKPFSTTISMIDIFIWLTENLCLFFLLLLSLYLRKSASFLICAFQLALTYERLSTHLITLFHSHSVMKRLSPLLNVTHQNTLTQTDTLPVINGDLHLINITHRKLKNITMHITAGSYTALIGASGEGKSTIFKLILGLEPLQQGKILFDHYNMHDINMNRLRKNFGVVLQTSSLFPGTIFSNISANTNITLDEAWELARLVALDEEVNAMPMKMFTYLSDNAGDSISGGQRQKILLARALATKPKILFLDEATSALDSNSEAVIFSNLQSLNITRFVITHRLSAIANADRIYQIKSGRVIIVSNDNNRG